MDSKQRPFSDAVPEAKLNVLSFHVRCGALPFQWPRREQTVFFSQRFKMPKRTTRDRLGYDTDKPFAAWRSAGALLCTLP